MKGMTDLDSQETITECDKGDMLGALMRFPTQCLKALELGEGFELPEYKDFDKVVVTGVGGSGIAGDLLKRLLDLPVFVSKGYSLPGFVDPKTLLIVISYSGKTVETLSSLRDGLSKGARIICISSGGQLEEISHSEDIPLIRVPEGMLPRSALGYLVLPILKVILRLGAKAVSASELKELPSVLEGLSKRLRADTPTESNPAKQIALRFLGKIPLIYGMEGSTDVVAQRWKTQFNENSKQPAFWNSFPELAHNEIEGFMRGDLLPNCRVIILRSRYDPELGAKQASMMGSFLRSRGIGFEEVWGSGEGKMAQVFSLIYLGDFVSVYLGILNGVDPTPVKAIEEFKRGMRVLQMR